MSRSRLRTFEKLLVMGVISGSKSGGSRSRSNGVSRHGNSRQADSQLLGRATRSTDASDRTRQVVSPNLSVVNLTGAGIGIAIVLIALFVPDLPFGWEIVLACIFFCVIVRPFGAAKRLTAVDASLSPLELISVDSYFLSDRESRFALKWDMSLAQVTGKLRNHGYGEPHALDDRVFLFKPIIETNENDVWVYFDENFAMSGVIARYRCEESSVFDKYDEVRREATGKYGYPVKTRESYKLPYTAGTYRSVKAIADDDATILSAWGTYNDFIVAVAPDSAVLLVYRNIAAKNFWTLRFAPHLSIQHWRVRSGILNPPARNCRSASA